MPNRANCAARSVPTPQSVVRGMLQLAKVTKNDFVIDLGCGEGYLTVETARWARRVVAIDRERMTARVQGGIYWHSLAEALRRFRGGAAVVMGV